MKNHSNFLVVVSFVPPLLLSLSNDMMTNPLSLRSHSVDSQSKQTLCEQIVWEETRPMDRTWVNLMLLYGSLTSYYLGLIRGWSKAVTA